MFRATNTFTSRNSAQRSRLLHRTAYVKNGTKDHSSSSKLFADAVEEDNESRDNQNPSSGVANALLQRLQQQEKPWDGDERMEDTVLRMLVDKYKPLRTGVVQSADAKLKIQSSAAAAGRGAAIGGIETSTSVLLDSLPPLGTASGTSTSKAAKQRSLEALNPEDPKARAEKKRAKRLDEGPGRIGRALESSLDYRMGKVVGEMSAPSINPGDTKASTKAQPKPRPNPVSMGGWAGLVEDQIERARSEGAFKNLSGRGKPLPREVDEFNPFVPREEFLMNRIVKRNGAAPPWVDIQGELEQSIQSFRGIIQASWVRRAARTILSSPLYSASTPVSNRPPLPPLETLAEMGDPEWEKKEQSYHEEALKEVNALIRKHNGVSPYAVRRPYLMREAELERCYRTSADDILNRVKESLAQGLKAGQIGFGDEESTGGGGAVAAQKFPSLGLWDALRRVAHRLTGQHFRANPPSPPSSSPPSASTGGFQT